MSVCILHIYISRWFANDGRRNNEPSLHVIRITCLLHITKYGTDFLLWMFDMIFKEDSLHAPVV